MCTCLLPCLLPPPPHSPLTHAYAHNAQQDVLDRVSDEAFAARAIEEFKAADTDGNGSLSADELLPVVESLLKDLAPAGSFKITHEHCVQFANVFDDDQNGTISLNEFFGFVQTITLIGYLQSQEQEQEQQVSSAESMSGGGGGGGKPANIATAAMAHREHTENRAGSGGGSEGGSEVGSESESESESSVSESESESETEGGQRRRTRSHAESHGSGQSNDAASYYGLDADAIAAAAAAAAGLNTPT